MTRRVVARLDSGLRAHVTRTISLRYVAGPDPALDRGWAARMREASGFHGTMS